MKKIYIAHSGNFDFERELYKPLRTSILEQKYDITLPHEHSDEQFDSKKFLENECACMIAEVSYPSTGLGIELGWANIFQVPIIAIHRKSSKISSAINVVTDKTEKYENEKDMVNKIIISLQQLFHSSSQDNI